MSEIGQNGMPYDADVLGQVLDDHDVPTKKLAARCHVHRATIHKYLGGQLTLPSFVLRMGFELTRDLRLICLITGAVPICCHPVLEAETAAGAGQQGGPTPVRIPPINELLPKTCESLEAAASAVRYIAKIVEDRRVDSSDAQAKAQFIKRANTARELLSLAIAALEAHEKRVVT